MVLKNYGISPNGHVYFNEHDWCADFSQQSLGTQSWLIHELTDVWQIQQGIKVVRKAIFDRQYQYVLEQGKLFLSYGIEQQAEIVRHIFLLRHGQKIRGAPPLEHYEGILPDSFRLADEIKP